MFASGRDHTMIRFSTSSPFNQRLSASMIKVSETFWHLSAISSMLSITSFTSKTSFTLEILIQSYYRGSSIFCINFAFYILCLLGEFYRFCNIGVEHANNFVEFLNSNPDKSVIYQTWHISSCSFTFSVVDV